MCLSQFYIIMDNSLLQLNLLSGCILFTLLCIFVTKLRSSNCLHGCFHEERFYGSYHFGDNTAFVQIAVRRLFCAFLKLRRTSLILFSICLCTAISSFTMFVSTRLSNRLFLSFWFSSCQPSVVGNLAAMPIPTKVPHA